MEYFTFVPEGAQECSVTAYLHTGMRVEEKQGKTYPGILICPGGAYRMVSEREAEPVAMEYFAAGYQAFVLEYSVGEQAGNFQPLCQLAAAIAHIRAHAKEWKLEEGHLAVCGFSAGGHLAASSGTLVGEPEFLGAFGRTEHVRPDALVLGYPVITANEFAHVESIENVSAAPEGSEAYRWFGLDGHVDAKTPPTFLWHTAEDDCVPVENSLRFAAALSASKVPFELHVFPGVRHGTSVCTDEVNATNAYNARWVGLSVAWLDRVFEHEK